MKKGLKASEGLVLYNLVKYCLIIELEQIEFGALYLKIVSFISLRVLRQSV